MEQKSFRDAAEMTVKWQMVEVEKQLQDLRGELKIKRTECAGATAQVHKGKNAKKSLLSHFVKSMEQRPDFEFFFVCAVDQR